VLGILLGHAGLGLLSQFASDAYGYRFEYWSLADGEWALGIAVLLIGFLAGLLPAIKAVRTPISDTLAGN
jgi:putative ABC transport system permease protein